MCPFYCSIHTVLQWFTATNKLGQMPFNCQPTKDFNGCVAMTATDSLVK